MKFASKLLGAVVVLALVVAVQADDKKEVTIKGEITCAKCGLKMDGQTKCATVIKEKKGDESIVYFLDAKSGKEVHGKICSEGKKGSVVGTVSEKDGKKTVTTKKENVKFED